MVADGARAAMDGAALEALADDLASLRFALSAADAPVLCDRAAALARLLRATVARTSDPEAPLLVVVAGGTGAGKSTTVNTLARDDVAATGVVRPTTHAPVVVCHPDDFERIATSAILPHLPRVHDDDGSAGGRRLVLTTSDRLTPGLAIVDTPDVDSVEAVNHQLAEDVLDVADAWLWFVTARTYADEVGARYLRLARDRQVLTAMVVTQVRDADRDEVLADVARLLDDQGVSVERLLHVPATTVTDGRIPEDAVAGLHDWLTDMAAPDVRAEVRRRALDGVRASIPDELRQVADALAVEVSVAERLRAGLDHAYGELPRQLDAELDRGIPLRADVLDRWRELVGGGDTMVRIQTATTRMRTMLRELLGTTDGPTESPRQVKAEVAVTLTETITRLLERASWDARRRFEEDPVGRDLLDRHPRLRGRDEDREHRVRAAVDAFGEHVAELVATVGAERRVQARMWSTALNAVATSAILVVFTVSGGLTGGELGIAALASAGSQALLVRLFGEQNLRNLLADARADIDERLRVLIAEDRAAHDDVIAAAAPPAGAVKRIAAAAEGRV